MTHEPIVRALGIRFVFCRLQGGVVQPIYIISVSRNATQPYLVGSLLLLKHMTEN